MWQYIVCKCELDDHCRLSCCDNNYRVCKCKLAELTLVTFQSHEKKRVVEECHPCSAQYVWTKQTTNSTRRCTQYLNTTNWSSRAARARSGVPACVASPTDIIMSLHEMFCIANLAATMRIPTWNSTVGLHVISELEQPNLLRSQGSPCCCSSHHPITSPFGPCRQYSSWTHSYLRFGISMIYIYIHIHIYLYSYIEMMACTTGCKSSCMKSMHMRSYHENNCVLTSWIYHWRVAHKKNASSCLYVRSTTSASHKCIQALTHMEGCPNEQVIV